MEEAYKMALEIIKGLVEKDGYVDKGTIITLCDIALNYDSEDGENNG